MHRSKSNHQSIPSKRKKSAFCPRQQAHAYSELLPVYESRLDVLQAVHAAVLDRVLDGMRAGDTVLEVGCGAGSSLELLASRGFRAAGIDISPEMTRAARLRSGCTVYCADFLKFEFAGLYDLVFAQAFVHLFPKAMASEIIRRLTGLTSKRAFFSTSLAAHPSEGLEKKDGVLRYRSRYTAPEFMSLIAASVAESEWQVEYFDLPDSFGKNWLDVIVHRRDLA